MESGETCRSGRHVVGEGRFVLRTPHPCEEAAALAGVADEEAQRRLGWPPETLVAAEQWNELLGQELPDPRLHRGPPANAGLYVLLDQEARKVAGGVSVTLCGERRRWEIGGWLVPAYRRTGLGPLLFTHGRTLAHDHLGVPTLYAGTEVDHAACLASLTRAGFVPDTTPVPHTLPDGRTITGTWLTATTPTPTTCRPPRRPLANLFRRP